jgi:hypothetical protein
MTVLFLATWLAVTACAAAQPPFEYQLWTANHVVIATALRSGENVGYRLQRVLKGNPATLKFREAQTLDVDDAMWRQLGRRAVTGDSVLLLLNGPRAMPPAHSALELDLLNAKLQFTHAQEDAGVRKTLSITDVERMLREPPFDTRSCGRITLRGEYLLCTEVLHAGTRSEGSIGRLYRHGAEIKGEQKEQAVNVDPTGGSATFIFRGNERPYLWSVSGWQMDGAR